MHDYSADLEAPKITPAFVTHITEVVARLTAAVQKAVDLEEQLKAAQAVVNAIQMKELPELLAEMELEEFTTSSGLRIKVKSDLKVSITKEKLNAAVAWMDENGFGDLVKRAFTVSFGRDEADRAAEFATKLGEEAGLDVESGMKIESSTLKKFVKDRLSEGGDLPLELFNVFEFKVAEVKPK